MVLRMRAAVTIDHFVRIVRVGLAEVQDLRHHLPFADVYPVVHQPGLKPFLGLCVVWAGRGDAHLVAHRV